MIENLTSQSEQNDVYRKCVERIMRIHHIAITSSGEEREMGLEDSLISSMALDGFCDRVVECPDCFSKAAMAIDYIVTFHPFVEGNKRTAFQLSVSLLKIEGYRLDDNDATFEFIKEIASGNRSRIEIEDWLRCNSHLSNL